MKFEREKLIRYSALAFAAAVALLSLILWSQRKGPGKLEAGLSLPRISPTPEITAAPTPAQVRVTAAPTPRVVQVVSHYPPEALDLVADGRVLFTVENAAAAQVILERYLQENAQKGIGSHERLVRAGFDQKLTLEEPSGRGELLTVDEAVVTLNADESLLPVARTVVRCVIERGERETLVRRNDRLPAGSRIYRSMGVYPYILSYYETAYRGQAAFSEVKTNEFALGPGRVDRLLEDGAYAMEEASAEAGPKAEAIEGFRPQWPVAGTVTESFGMGPEGMTYAVEITAEGVTRAVAPEGGVVIYCGQRGHLGLVVDILHDDTGCVSRIMGCKRPLVELYQRVRRGEPVAVLPEPASGRTITVRYELLLNGLPVNPEKYLPKK